MDERLFWIALAILCLNVSHLVFLIAFYRLRDEVRRILIFVEAFFDSVEIVSEKEV